MRLPNPIWVAGDIDDQKFFRDFTFRLSELLRKTRKNATVTLFINSSGGDAHTALGIYDLIQSSERRVIGLVCGRAESGASIILQGCSTRLITANSTMIIHASEIGHGRGTIEITRKVIDGYAEMDDRIHSIYAKRMETERDEIASLLKETRFLTAQEAVEMQVVDKILQ